MHATLMYVHVQLKPSVHIYYTIYTGISTGNGIYYEERIRISCYLICKCSIDFYYTYIHTFGALQSQVV